MKDKKFEGILYSTVGVVAMLAVAIAVYIITSPVKVRLDMTADKAFTLSQGTRHILNKLASPVTLRYYCSQAAMPPEGKPYAQEIEDLLGEYVQAAHGKIRLQKLDPIPDSDAEDSARSDGVEGQPLEMGGDPVYFGLAVSQLDNKVAIPSWLDVLRDPSKERLFEYQISQAIARVENPELVTIGIMSAEPVMGEEPNPLMQQMGNQQQTPPQVFVTELKKEYNVVDVPMTADKIDDGIKVLIVQDPRGITDTGEYAIDQFIMRGGKVIANLDPAAALDPQHDQMEQIMRRPSPGQSSLPKLLKEWGLDMDLTKVVADADSSMHNNGSILPTVLLVTSKGVNQSDIITSSLDNLMFAYAGAITGKPADGLTETVLAHSTTNSELVDSITAVMGGDQILKDFQGTGVPYAIAVRLTGKFKTAFPDGKPSETPGGPTPTNEVASLKESPETAVILVSDSDYVMDGVAFQVSNFGGMRMAQPMNGDANLLLNAIEQLAGDNDLIAVRSRGGLNRPFIRLQQLEANAGKQWEEELKKIEDLRDQTQQKISELQAAKGGGSQQFILSPEQRAELQKEQTAEADYGKQLRQVQKNLRKDTDSLETRIRVYNIFAMPVLVALTGIALFVIKSKKTAAK